MKNLKLFLILSTCQCVFSYYLRKRQDFHVNNFINPVESYVGPSSYTTSYSTSDINDYPAIGNFGSLIDMKNPQISSSFTSFGPSDSGEMESTSYINYPPQTTTIIHDEAPTQNQKIPQLSPNAISSSNFNLFNHLISTGESSQNQKPSQSAQNSFPNSNFNFINNQFPSQDESNQKFPQLAQNSFSPSNFNFLNQPSQNPSFNPAIPQDFAKLISSTFDNLVGKLPPPSTEVISEHVEVTKPIAVPVYKKFPYPQPKHFPVAIPHPVLIPVPAPYPVNVMISEPVAVPILKELKVPVEKEVMYPVQKNIPVEVERPLKFRVEKHFPVYVPKPYPVKIPIIKTVIHKAPKKWARAQEKTFTMKKPHTIKKKMH